MANLLKFILMLVFTSCNYFQIVHAQYPEEGNSMIHFNVEGFHQNQEGGIWVEQNSDGTLIRSFELSSSGFLQEIKPLNSPYTYKNAFDANGNLSARVTEFYQARIGISKYYDLQGNIVREEDHGHAFTYSLEDLIKDMLKNFGVDLMNPEHIKSFTRFIAQESGNEPLYMLYAYKGAMPGTVDGYIINGQTGELLLRLSFDAENPSTTIYAEYLRRMN